MFAAASLSAFPARRRPRQKSAAPLCSATVAPLLRCSAAADFVVVGFLRRRRRHQSASSRLHLMHRQSKLMFKVEALTRRLQRQNIIAALLCSATARRRVRRGERPGRLPTSAALLAPPPTMRFVDLPHLTKIFSLEAQICFASTKTPSSEYSTSILIFRFGMTCRLLYYFFCDDGKQYGSCRSFGMNVAREFSKS